MEHICEWPTDMDISVQPGWRESEAAIAGLVFLWIAQGGSPRKAALHCAIVRTRDWTHPSKLLLAYTLLHLIH